jgi:hypothetical protein
VVRSREIDYLERECLGAVIAHVPEGDRQSDPPKRGGLFARDHSVEWMWAALEQITGKPQHLKGVKVHKVEATAPIHECLGEPGRPDQRVNYEGKPP